jgi:SacI homology domain
VAYIHGKPIFVITEVALTPLSSRKEAETAVEHTKTNLQRRTIDKTASDGSDSEDDDGEHSAAASDDVEDEDPRPVGLSDASLDGTIKGTGRARQSSIAEDVMTRKGGYGLFTQKWFSGRGWTVNQRRNLGMSATETESSIDTRTGSSTSLASAVNQNGQPSEAAVSEAEPEGPIGPIAPKQRDVAATMLPKLLRTTRLLFGTSRSFFFSYDYDITRSIANQKLIRGSEVPLHKDVDPLYFWNRHVIQPFIDAGQHSFVLPLMQGFVGQRTFIVETNPAVEPFGDDASSSMVEMKEMTPGIERHSLKPPTNTSDYFDGRSEQIESMEPNTVLEDVKPAMVHSSHVEDTRAFLLTLISRRSIKRAGLRYLRRGIDDDGNTANSVETEQILSSTDWSPTGKTYSFVQFRGSIPLFFSQSPYSFKPIPQLLQSEDANFRALKKHFSNLSARYGSIQVASLVEKHGVEAQIGEEYEKQINRLNESGGVNNAKVGFEWFDFHAMCRGMKFENVSLLLDKLGATLDAFGTTVETENKLLSKQSGILRMNCMDCLDRTNVVQSACGRRALENQLKEEGIDLSLQTDQTTEWFNTLWADNGDAISKQYASTAALKGDFTRTRKRNFKGALTDMGLSISRFYTG